MAVLQTYQVATAREDLTDVLVNITPTKTPLLSSLKSVKMYGTVHETSVDDLDTPTDNSNKWIQGADAVEEDQTMPDKVLSWPQIFRKHPKVADTTMAIRIAGGIKNAYSYQVTKKTKELGLDIEFALLNAPGNAGNATTPSEIKGALPGITTNVLDGDNSGSPTPLTEEMYNNLTQLIWDAGGDPDITYATGTLKRVISGFTGGANKNIEATSKKLIATVDVYEGDFGLQKIVAHRMMPVNTFMTIEKQYWALAWLRKTKHVPLAKTGDSTRGMIRAELTLERRQEKASGKYVNVSK
jgi:hypothetical protein